MTMMRYRLDRRAALGLIGGSAASVLVPVPGARVNAPPSITVEEAVGCRRTPVSLP